MIIQFMGDLPSAAGQSLFLVPWTNQRSSTVERFLVMPAPGVLANVLAATAPWQGGFVGRKIGVPYAQSTYPQNGGQGQVTTVTRLGSGKTDRIQYDTNPVTVTWSIRKNGAPWTALTHVRNEAYLRAGESAAPPTYIYQSWNQLGPSSGHNGDNDSLELRARASLGAAFVAGDRISAAVSYTPEWSGDTPSASPEQPGAIVRLSLKLTFGAP